MNDEMGRVLNGAIVVLSGHYCNICLEVLNKPSPGIANVANEVRSKYFSNTNLGRYM
jgi:hypothetical protein